MRKAALAACAAQSSVVDEFPPYAWQGNACADWANDFTAFNNGLKLEIEKSQKAIERKKWNSDERKLKRHQREAKANFSEMQANWKLDVTELERLNRSIVRGEAWRRAVPTPTHRGSARLHPRTFGGLSESCPYRPEYIAHGPEIFQQFNRHALPARDRRLD